MIDMKQVEQERSNLNLICNDFLTVGTLNGYLEVNFQRKIVDIINTDFEGSTMKWLNMFIGTQYNDSLLTKHKLISNCLDRAILLDFTAGQFYTELAIDLYIANNH